MPGKRVGFDVSRVEPLFGDAVTKEDIVRVSRAILTQSAPTLSALGPTGKLVYAYLTYGFMMRAYSFINVPYSSLLGVISPSPRIRTLAAVSTRQDDWAGYIDQFRQRVERVGNASFPAEARTQHLQGQVRLLVAIYPDGRVQRIQILQSSGHAILDRAAEQSVRQAEPFARFPASQQGQIDVLQIIRTWRFAETLATGV